MKKLLLIVVLVLVLVAVAFLFASWLGRKPVRAPALADGPGIFRLHTERLDGGGHREPYRITYAGATVTVQVAGIEDDRASMRIDGAAGTALGTRDYRAGDRVEVDGAVLTVVAVHDLRRHDVVDVRLSAS